MPVPDQVTLDKSETIISDLKKISKNVLSEEEEKAAYETDGLSIHRQRPIVVVLPETTAEVSKESIPKRRSGTSQRIECAWTMTQATLKKSRLSSDLESFDRQVNAAVRSGSCVSSVQKADNS